MDASRLYRRFWLLSLLAGLERAGSCPIALSDLNGVVYLANATSPCFDIEPMDAIVRKSNDGPLYPQIIWEIDRLVGVGLVRVSGLLVAPSQMHKASYSITRAGLDLVRSARARHGEFDRLASALWGIAMSYASAPHSVAAAQLLSRDANYAQASVANGDVVDFGEWETVNWTKDAVARIQSTVRQRVSSQDSAALKGVVAAAVRPATAVKLYAEYLSEIPEAVTRGKK